MKKFKTPGVYIQEKNAFPNSVVPVNTSAPAFIGYTPQAIYRGESYLNKPIKIFSFKEFQSIFCYPESTNSTPPTKQYNPQFYLVEDSHSAAPSKDQVQIRQKNYDVLPDANTIYYLYNSIRLFYQNGGGPAYIVSVGGYGEASGKPVSPGNRVCNPNVKLEDLKTGLEQLKAEQEPTMYVCPEATLLSENDNAILMQAMLSQCEELKTAISIFDIIGADTPDPATYFNDITAFRKNTGNSGLDFGAAYFPFIQTNISPPSEINNSNLFGGDPNKLKQVLSPDDNPDPKINVLFEQLETNGNRKIKSRMGWRRRTNRGPDIDDLHPILSAASEDYKYIMKKTLEKVNLLPTGGAIAGIITSVDNSRGVWKMPANVSINSAVSLPINLTNDQQADLNVDAVTGKSINAIREFPGKGILLWGARTLDGNSQEWRYISVRRTMIYIEQSCKLAIKAYTFELNNANTWTTVKSMIENFLNNTWKYGGLAGSVPQDAYSVQCGLGETMTRDDVRNQIMNVTIMVAVTKPAEFMIIQIQQKMASL